MTGPVERKAASDGLQGERTSLAWTRTSFAVLGNGALFMGREIVHYNGPLRLVPVALAGFVALLTYLAGRRRQRRLRSPHGPGLAPRFEVWLVGVSVITLIVVSCVALPL